MAISDNVIQELPSRVKSIPQWIWALALIVSAIILLSCGLRVQRLLSSASWPTVPGVIDTSDIDFVPVTRGMTKYQLQLRYHYVVDGTRFTADRVSFAGGTGYIGRTGSERNAKQVRENYPKGTAVTVHHHPTKPGVAVLETDIPGRLIKILLLGLAMTLLSITGIWRRWSLQTDYLFKPYNPDAPMTVNRFILGGLGLAVCLGIVWIWWELIKKYAGF